MVRKLALVCGRVGTDFGLNKGTNQLSIILREPLKPAYIANLLLAEGFRQPAMLPILHSWYCSNLGQQSRVRQTILYSFVLVLQNISIKSVWRSCNISNKYVNDLHGMGKEEKRRQKVFILLRINIRRCRMYHSLDCSAQRFQQDLWHLNLQVAK